MTDAVTRGIERRRAGVDVDVREGTCWAVDDLVQRAGLPGVNSERGGFDPEYIQFLYDLAELLEREWDAGAADQMSEVHFIHRQVVAAIERAKQKFSGPFSRPKLPVPRSDQSLPLP